MKQTKNPLQEPPFLLFPWFPMAALLVLTAAPLPAQTPLLEFRFNETGTLAADSGSLGGSALFKNAEGAAVDLHGPASSGVSGHPDDRSFDNTASTGMGTMGGEQQGGVAAVSPSPLPPLESLTLAGWFKTSESDAGGAARLIHDLGASPVGGFSLQANRGHLTLFINSVEDYRESQDANELSHVNEWVFFAVTYDGTRNQDNVHFYCGSWSDEVRLIGTGSFEKGAIQANNLPSGLGIGNLPGSQPIRPFDGDLDNIRVFGEQSGASGVLTIDQIEKLRKKDVANENQ